MRRPHRAFHRLVWLPLSAVVLLGFVLALAWRPPPDPPEPSTVEAAK